MKVFQLHPQLAADTLPVADLPLCRLLLANDSNYPWTILVPRRDNIREQYLLGDSDQQQLMIESSTLCKALQVLFSPDKLNVAALGNMVPQLHIHHIARFTTDAAWPAPVWGKVAARPYNGNQQYELAQQLVDKITLKVVTL